MFLIFLILLQKKMSSAVPIYFFKDFFLFSSKVEIFLQMTVKSTWSRFSTFSLTDQKLYYGSFLPWKRALGFLRPKCRNHCHKCPTFQRIACQWKTGRPPWWAWPQPRRCDYAWHARAQEPHANWTEDSNRILQHWLLRSLDWKFKIQIIFFAKINVKFFTYSDILTLNRLLRRWLDKPLW